jgi:aspartyl-tRNA(Asn)/glutamyl-tRNA(Gln) amidotransferase subunit A
MRRSTNEYGEIPKATMLKERGPLGGSSCVDYIAQQLADLSKYSFDGMLAMLNRRDADALREAAAWDVLGYAVRDRPPLFGTSLAVKACFDVAGWRTTAGSKVLQDQPPSVADAPIVAALRRNGAIVTGQTNMTEFAFGALGVNPHFGTPRTPLDPNRERIAGGSTSGGAVGVKLHFADLALGSDTSGSVRIPAAFCGLTGFKPSRRRYADSGMIFLSPSFDVPGFIARNIESCSRADSALTGDPTIERAPTLSGRRFLIPSKFALDCADANVTEHFLRAVMALENAGANIIERDWPELETYGMIAVEGGTIIAEAFAWHKPYLETRGADYDPRVGSRITHGKDVKAHDYIRAKERLARAADSFRRGLSEFDALLTPTVPILPPKISSLATDENYYSTNQLVFRLTEVANRINAPSVSIPVDPAHPIGLMLTGFTGRDRELLTLAAAVEATVQRLSDLAWKP